jgi:crossover junction endodeoxyribonuclease RuvC
MVQPNRIIGIDPGLRNTGWGIIEQKNNQLTYIAHGVIRPCQSSTMSERLAFIFVDLMQVLKEHAPQTAAVEETFVNKNARSALKLGEARGIALATPAVYGISVSEYAANKIKKAVVGVGHADKNQVMIMVKTLLPKCGDLSSDAADALAIAICHAHHSPPIIIDTKKAC